MNLDSVLARLILAALIVRPGFAAEPPPPQAESSPPAIRELGNGLFQIGAVKFSKEEKTVSFPARVNMTAGLLEYLLVGNGGKTHESLFATEVEPYQLQFAMLLIGAKDGSESGAKSTPPPEITASYLKSAPSLKGDNVTISVRWNIDGKETLVPAEDLVMNDAKKKPMTRGPWTYNGSMVSDGKFLAQEELSFVALVTDPAALLNNPRPGNDDDTIWSVNTRKVPPLNTPVEIIVKIQPPKTTTTQK